MQGHRCPECGETRWHLLPVEPVLQPKCSICGAVMVDERRRPGRGKGALALERRETPAASAP